MNEFKQLRESKKLTQLRCAQYLGVTPRTIQRWESGEIKAPDMAVKLLSLIE